MEERYVAVAWRGPIDESGYRKDEVELTAGAGSCHQSASVMIVPSSSTSYNDLCGSLGSCGIREHLEKVLRTRAHIDDDYTAKAIEVLGREMGMVPISASVREVHCWCEQTIQQRESGMITSD